MLNLKGIRVLSPTGSSDHALLDQIDLNINRGHFGAIVGPSGCGKSTLLKTIAGLLEPEDGEIFWMGRNLDEDEDFHPSELGYVPQFSIFHNRLTVREVVRTATQLRTTGGDRQMDADAWTEHVLSRVGLLEIADRRSEVLSGGQQRRLGLALELVTRPTLLLCDEVTSGLDPKSEDEIVQLMASLVEDQGRVVLSVTHSLRHLHQYDSITVLVAGRLVYHGPPDHLLSFFQVSAADEVFPALSQQPLEFWLERFDLYRPYEQSSLNQNREAMASVETASAVADGQEETESTSVMSVPFAPWQAWVLMFRRFRLFLRDPAQIGLQLALIFTFPAVVVLFAYEGLPEIRNMSLAMEQNVVEYLKERLEYTIQTSRVGSLVSGLVMFQVILLTLMGANNAAREIANERHILEKEKLSGVSSVATLISKLCFLLPLVGAQSFWMAWFVKTICNIPGDWTVQFWLLFWVNAAMTVTSLAISAWAKTSEQASLISIYLVGFQLPLSGTVLALPELLAPLIRPFIAAYWAWSGYLQALRETRFYDLVIQISNTPVAEVSNCYFILMVHLGVGVFIAWLGLSKSQWAE
ncbi:MAG: ATP-binding cassette domain-containing protein [Verrucomicrobiota bacterium]